MWCQNEGQHGQQQQESAKEGASSSDHESRDPAAGIQLLPRTDPEVENLQSPGSSQSWHILHCPSKHRFPIRSLLFAASWTSSCLWPVVFRPIGLYLAVSSHRERQSTDSRTRAETLSCVLAAGQTSGRSATTLSQARYVLGLVSVYQICVVVLPRAFQHVASISRPCSERPIGSVTVHD